jgi:HSP20 family protein
MGTGTPLAANLANVATLYFEHSTIGEREMEKEKKNLTVTRTPDDKIRPIMVEPETMFDRFAEISKEIAHRAFEFFQTRGREFGTHLDDWLKAESEILRPTPVEITENGDTVNVRAAVPGFKPEEIEVSINGDRLFMSGEAKSEQKKEDENTFYSEWRSNRFCRQLTLPSKVETDGVHAVLKDGVLTLALKKAAERGAAKVSVKTA